MGGLTLDDRPGMSYDATITAMNRLGFTLIELLVTISILALLAAMAMPLISIANRQAKRANTVSILAKVEAGLRQFRRDIDVLPYQSAYPDAVAPSEPFPNNLLRRLGGDLSNSDHQALRGLAATAASKFGYPENLHDGGATETAALPSPVAFRMAWLPVNDWNIPWGSYGPGDLNKRRFCYVLNRMAARRATDAMHAGAFDLRGPLVAGADNVVTADRTGQRVVSTAEVGAGIGWCADYLLGELPPAAVRGEAILDAWGRPLVYVGQVVPKAKPFTHRESQFISDWAIQSYRVSYPQWPGLGSQGFAIGTGPWNAMRSAGRLFQLGSGRVPASGPDGLGQPIDAHPTFLPDPAQPRRSDRRYYSASRLELDFELWSAGPDGHLAWMRDDLANRDNLAAAEYDRGLP